MIKKRDDIGIKYCNDPNACIECPDTMDDVYKNIDEYKQNINGKNLNAFDDMIADIMTNKKFQTLIKEVFIS